jgi:hypothetical protein
MMPVTDEWPYGRVAYCGISTDNPAWMTMFTHLMCYEDEIDSVVTMENDEVCAACLLLAMGST